MPYAELIWLTDAAEPVALRICTHGHVVAADQRVHRPPGAGHRDRVVGASAGAGVALGPITGGCLLEHFWRGSIFLLMVPIAVVVAVYQQTRRQ